MILGFLFVDDWIARDLTILKLAYGISESLLLLSCLPSVLLSPRTYHSYCQGGSDPAKQLLNSYRLHPGSEET